MLMAARRPLSKSQYEDLAAFRLRLREFLRFSENAALAAGVTAQQYQALLVIKGFPGRDHVTIGELADRLLIRHHSAVGLTDRLALENLVERCASKGDRRQVNVRLTARGERILAGLVATHREELRLAGPELRHLIQQVNLGETRAED